MINENVDSSGEWLEAAQTAYKNTYAFEWQGDSLLLAREAMLFTFIENYKLKFGKEPLLKSIQYVAYIISWNVWQMDGLKFVLPNSCTHTIKIENNLFGQIKTQSLFCEGCLKNDNNIHTGKYCIIKNWDSKDPLTKKKGQIIKFIDILKNK